MMTSVTLPEILLKNLSNLGFDELLPDQLEIISQILKGEGALISSHLGAGKLTAAVIAMAALLIKAERPLEPGRPPRMILLTGHSEDAHYAVEVFEKVTAGTGLNGVAVAQCRDIPRMRDVAEGIDFLAGSADLLKSEPERSGIDKLLVERLVFSRCEDWVKNQRFLAQIDAYLKASPEAVQRSVVALMDGRICNQVSAMIDGFEDLKVLNQAGRWRFPRICEEFLLAKPRSRLSELFRLIHEAPKERHILVIAPRRRVDQIVDVLEIEGLTVRGADDIYSVDQARAYWELKHPRVVVVSEAVSRKFEPGLFDQVIFAEPATSAANYQNALSRVAFRPTPQRPYFGRALTIFLPNQIGDFIGLRNELGGSQWQLLNPKLLPCVVPQGFCLGDEASQKKIELGCWRAVLEALPKDTHVPELPEELAADWPGNQGFGHIQVSPEAEAIEALLAQALNERAAKAELEWRMLALSEASKEKGDSVNVNECELATAAAQADSKATAELLPAVEPNKSIKEPVSQNADAPSRESLDSATKTEAADVSSGDSFDWISEAYGADAQETDELEAGPLEDSQDEGESLENQPESEESNHRRTLTIRAGYVPHDASAPAVTITEPLSSNTVELRAAQARMRREMKADKHLTHQLVGKRGTLRRNKKAPALASQEAEGILGSQPASRKPFRKGAPKPQPFKKSTASGKTAPKKNFKRQKAQEAPEQALLAQSESALLLPMTTPAATDGMLPAEDGAKKFKKKGRGLRNVMQKRREQHFKADEGEVLKSSAPSEPVQMSESAHIEAPAVAPEQKRNKKFFGKKKPRSGSSFEKGGEARAERPSRGFSASREIDDDNFGNSIHYKMKGENRPAAMPWQVPAAYGSERPVTLSFAQTMPDVPVRSGMHSTYDPQSRGGKKKKPQGPQAGANKGPKKFGKFHRGPKKNPRRQSEGGSGGYSNGSGAMSSSPEG